MDPETMPGGSVEEGRASAVDAQREVVGRHLEAAERRAKKRHFDDQIIVGDQRPFWGGEGVDQVFGGERHGIHLRRGRDNRRLGFWRRALSVKQR